MARFACTSIMESGSCGSSWERRMSDDYLWDPTAVPDPEIQRLEALLRPAAYTSAPLRESTVPPRRIRVGVWSALAAAGVDAASSEDHTSELHSLTHLVCRLLLAKKKSRPIGGVHRSTPLT